MTYQTLEDGTRVYPGGMKYKPVPDEKRKYRRRKPDVEGAERWRTEWVLPLVVLPMQDRVMPETKPDDLAYDHAGKPRKCRCAVCKRPQAREWRRRWRADQRQILRSSVTASS